MNKLKIWFDGNKLLLNLIKIKIMLFRNCKPSSETKIEINGVTIERVQEHTFLGVIIDDKVNWKPHIQYKQKKISKSIFYPE